MNQIEKYTMEPKRANGYYWVKAAVITPHNKEWQVAEYIDGSWFVEGEDCCMPDEVFHEINETRLLSPEEIKSNETSKKI